MTIGAILTLGFGTFSDVNHLVTLGYGTGATPTPTPTPTPTAEVQGSSGGSSLGFDEWLARHPWLRDVQVRPNWYEYPSEKAKLKREIVKVAKQKKSIERELSFAKGTTDLQAMLARLNELQEKLSSLMEFYRQAIAAYKAAEAEEESEFMDLMMEML